MIFNYDQEKVIDAGVNYILKGNYNEAFQFSGKAGTGKSVVEKEIQRRSGVPEFRVAPMAYIGQAAIIMRLKGFPNARTAHSWLYDVEIDNKKDALNNYVYNEYFGTRENGLVFVPKPLENIDLIMVDEGGTMPLRMKKDIESHNKPIVVAGDINQLPPVMDKPAYLSDPSKVMFLTQIMRQKENSSIVYLAERALQSLPIHQGYYGDALVITDDQVSNDMIMSSDMVLCGTNATRDRINKLVREEILGFHGTLPNYNEKVICRKNDWAMSIDGIGLGNGLVGRIVNQPEVSDFDGKVFYMDFKPDLFNGVFYHIDVDYEYFIANCVNKKDMKNRKWETGHLFDYAYCITTHLAQGAQAANVLYFEEYAGPMLQDKLNYTAITRAEHNLIYVKKKKIFSFFH